MATSHVHNLKDHPASIPSIVALWQAQEQRQRQLDSRLHAPLPASDLERSVRQGLAHGLVVLGEDGKVRGYAHPGIWSLPETSLLHAFLTPKNGITHALVLPDPQEPDAQEVAAIVLLALSDFWHTQHITGNLIRWPSRDPWFESLLIAHGFALDSVCALRPHPPVFAQLHASSFTVRPARQEDEGALIGLFQEELTFHEHYTPFVRSNSVVLSAFQGKLARLWAGRNVSEGAPFIVVAERAGNVLGMAENTLLTVEVMDEPGFTPPGQYGCLDNVCVHEQWRGQGVGRLLLHASFEMWESMQQLTLDGYVLWYNPDNPRAVRFWSRWEYEPLWTTYQQLPLATHV
ncbi:GNAT family N-acetyltransferase [Ktedonobacter robiniae]|uniref:N-acetyltransferase domain-containing protein n=1 Tax=Ktedonobacter robiniae TaxID=2778365 RepID=A0ABQ3V238_9CHLR|nr:GNAT family N-acetyltransferase [Ktedonobacter robiniae]GHO59219.1 hypothetical protein KSB_76940 [Ktedonobacter robiniae]